MTTSPGTCNQTAIRIEPRLAGAGFRLQAELILPQHREQVFEFFSNAFELERITPPWLHFSVLTPAPISMSDETLIDYRLRLRGIPICWQSRISVWEPPFRFVDEQVRGPFRRWYHEHTFEEVASGTCCRDKVYYEVPGGRLINRLFVQGELRRIFLYRQRSLARLFGIPHELSVSGE